MSFKIMKRLLYGRSLQFTVGATTRPEVPQSSAAVTRAHKAQAVQQVRSKAKKDDELMWLLLQHLRENLSSSSWYSLPREMLEELKIQKLGQALTSAFSQSNTGPVVGALPLADATHFQPIRDLRSAGKLALQGRETDSVAVKTPSSSFLCIEPDDDDGVVLSTSRHKRTPSGREPSLVLGDTSLQDLVASAGRGDADLDLVVFRIPDKSPAAKKRPLGAVDDVSPTDFCIRLYTVHSTCSRSDEVCVSMHACTEVPLVRLLGHSGADRTLSQRLMDSMLQWTVKSDVQFYLRDPAGCPSLADNAGAMEVLQELLNAGAVHGSDKAFPVVGLDEAYDSQLAALQAAGVVVRGRVASGKSADSANSDSETLQLAASAVTERIILHNSRRAFQPRVGVPWKYNLLQPKRGIMPSQLEVLMLLQDHGWTRTQWTGSSKELKQAFFEEGQASQ
ncbi:unnamed protein product [Symbiodinium sp. CCMP2592]|nr:unnamed protein product [Symbiodinium sp. CCMP2592]